MIDFSGVQTEPLVRLASVNNVASEGRRCKAITDEWNRTVRKQ